ncbi:thioredoxin-dependent thiol peroxidase [Marinomonas mediterranea]|jgi:Peroxiredoxin|uniref:thioredoxin-dependent peroxiredoxin n=1 Tax=Marinomonas mediterranea (strain ATCC 700492 / JCM 21426 / NBRC 103028 / MMB-1) TaxID=717774 RepID=F2K2U7_MARM1|nr:thioredoxin-dependent thiol peroxidase [Marinomonas mediterranea]ADZ91230.1 alkyl hydroperoxide reductase/ Thiol specific antioxidant/ Mal allergen [Marinomonas mediterranea MMB-1]WCN13288.1 thioredoxin-dependent thiol peroxidase [Marinomonas mediterranea]WCN17356.1 thioredoxin-dependent thiol peroxidase [Marinomonas mediterranea MMB-1]
MSLNIGDIAPHFTSKDQEGSDISLSDFSGKKVVLYFYPKDSTPGCTAQACNLRDNYQALLDQDYVVLGVSTDTEKRHQNFIKKNELPFPLIADVEKEVHELYDTWQLKKFMGKEYMGTVRTTFIIDEQGKIEDIITKVKTKDHTAQILK